MRLREAWPTTLYWEAEEVMEPDFSETFDYRAKDNLKHGKFH